MLHFAYGLTQGQVHASFEHILSSLNLNMSGSREVTMCSATQLGKAMEMESIKPFLLENLGTCSPRAILKLVKQAGKKFYEKVASTGEGMSEAPVHFFHVTFRGRRHVVHTSCLPAEVMSTLVIICQASLRSAE